MPHHKYGVDELLVVSVRFEYQVMNVTIPTLEEFYRERYKDDPQHLAYCLSIAEHTNATHYNLDELVEMMKNETH